MEGIIARQEKPTNTEVLGMLLEDEKLNYITNLHGKNIKGLLKLEYLTMRLENPELSSLEIHNKLIAKFLALKCSEKTKEGNRSAQIVDALKHIIEDENQDSIKTIADQIKG